MRSSHGGWVLNMGGAHGTPGLAGEENIVAVRHAKRSSFEKAAKLLRGDELTPEMRQQVENAFMYRWTNENQNRLKVYKPCPSCDIKQPYVNEQSSEGHNHPTIPLQSDDQWIAEHAFYFLNDGRLDSRHRNAEPVYLAQKASHVASVGLQFAIEKSAMHTGVPAYMYKAAFTVSLASKASNRNSPRPAVYRKTWTRRSTTQTAIQKARTPNGGGEADSPQHCDSAASSLRIR